MKRILGIIGLIVLIAKVDAQNVGIGTEDPENRLHVVGDIRGDSLMINIDSTHTEVMILESNSAVIERLNGGSSVITHGPHWQSFTAIADGSSLRISLFFSNTPSFTQLKIYAGEGTGGTELFLMNVASEGPGCFSFPCIPLNVDSGDVYTIWLDDFYGITFAFYNAYSEGVCSIYPDVDLNFRISVADETPLIIEGNAPARLALRRPGSRLDVEGSINSPFMHIEKGLGIGTTSSNRPLTIKAANASVMGVQNHDGIEKWIWWLDNVGENLVLSPGGLNNMFVAHQNGNIGMGNYYPETKLHIARYSMNSGANGLLRVENYGEGGAGIEFKNSIEFNPWQCFVDHDGKFKIGKEGIGNHLSVLTGGNVGIGTEAPSYRLDAQVGTSNTTVARFKSNGGYADILIGNSSKTAIVGADDQGAYVGTYSPDDLRFRLGGLTRAIFGYQNGHMGIGTEQPNYRLDARVQAEHATVAQFRTLGGFADVLVQNGTEQLSLGVDNGGGYVRMQSAHDLRLQTTNATRMFIDHETGHIGLGTTSPAYRLDTQLDGANATLAQFKTTGGYADILVGNSSKTAIVGADDQGAYIGAHSNDDLKFKLGGLTRAMFRYENGFFGIGTDQPNYLLDAQVQSTSATLAQFRTLGGDADILVQNGAQQLSLGVNDIGGYIRMRTGHDLQFQTNYTTRMFVDHETGHVGLGTTSPVYRLDTQLDGVNATIARFKTTGGYANILVGNSSKTAVVGADDQGAYIGAHSNDDLKFKLGGLTRAMFRYENGFFGIGTDQPNYLLDAQVQSTSATLAQFKTLGGDADILVQNGAQQLSLGVNDIGGYIRMRTGHDLHIQTNYTTRVFIDHESGNVGIGSYTAEQKLDVNGNVRIAGVILNESTIAPTLLNNWVNYDGGFETSGFFKDKFGMVHLKGLVRSGTSAHIMTLPEGYRPVGTLIFTVVSGNGFARIDVKSNGDVTLIGTYSTDYVSLSGIVFRI